MGDLVARFRERPGAVLSGVTGESEVGAPGIEIDPQEDVTPEWSRSTATADVSRLDRDESVPGAPRREDSVFDYVPSMASMQIADVGEPPRSVATIVAGGVAGVLALGVVLGVMAMQGDDDQASAKAAGPGIAKVAAPLAEPTVVAADGPADDESDTDADIVILDDIEIDEDEILILDDDEVPGAGGERRRRPPGPGAAVPAPTGAAANLAVVDLSPLRVRKTIRSKMVHLHRCYDEALQMNEGLAGKIEIVMTIGIVGRVTDVELATDTLRNKGVAACVQAQVRGWRFRIGGRLAEPTEVAFPVTFKGKRG